MLWDQSYNYSGSVDDRAFGICLDPAGNVVVAGYSALGVDNTQFTTLKYSNSGTAIWAKFYDISPGADTAKTVTADANGNIYVAGTFNNGSNQDLKTVKYDSSGNLKWEIEYNGPHNRDDRMLDMTHNGEELIVTAQIPKGSAYQYIALKYIESDYESPHYSGTADAFHNAFVRNLGQVKDETGTPVTDVKYLSKQGSYAGFYKNDAFELMTRTYHNDTTVNDTVQKVSLYFDHPEANAKVYAFGRSAYFENYYAPGSIRERVPFFKKLYYKGIWEGISMETAFKSGQEYSYTITSKGNARDIALSIAGADSIVKTAAGDILLYTFNGAFRLGHPRAYQKNGSGNLTELSWTPAFAVDGNLLNIDSIGSYDTQKDLILRISKDLDDIPQTDGFCHSTYFGGVGTNKVNNATTDSNGNPIFCGEMDNYNFYIGENGLNVIGLQIGSNPFTYGFVTKFNPDFVPAFMTVYYGSLNTRFNAIATKSNNDIYLGGTSSGGNIVFANVLNGSFQDNTYTGASQLEGIIVGLDDVAGSLIYSTYYGANGFDWINDIAIDSQDRLYVGGVYFDSQNFHFKFMTGAYFSQENGSNLEAGYIARFGSDLGLDWATSIGGNLGEIVTAVAVGSDDRVAISGMTSSSNFDIATYPETYQDLTSNGSTDYFLMVFDNQVTRIWVSYENGGGNLDINSGLTGIRTLDFGSDNSLYFGFNLGNVSTLNFQDPGSGALYLDDDYGVGSYMVLTKYSPVAFSPVWRTKLMDGEEGLNNKVHTLEVIDNKVIVGGNAFDPSLDLESADMNLYSEPKSGPIGTGSTSDFNDAFLMVFNEQSGNLIHSTYFGGSGATSINDNVMFHEKR